MPKGYKCKPRTRRNSNYKGIDDNYCFGMTVEMRNAMKRHHEVNWSGLIRNFVAQKIEAIEAETEVDRTMANVRR